MNRPNAAVSLLTHSGDGCSPVAHDGNADCDAQRTQFGMSGRPWGRRLPDSLTDKRGATGSVTNAFESLETRPESGAAGGPLRRLGRAPLAQ